MFGKSPYPLNQKDARLYTASSLFLYALFLLMIITGVLSTLFPFTRSVFDFNNPDATKNTIFAPQLSNLEPIENGKISKGDNLTFYAHNPHVLESATLTLNPSKSSAENTLQNEVIKIQKGWSALFFPKSEILVQNSGLTIVTFENTYYLVRDQTLYPFVSENAALSHEPREKIMSLTPKEYTKFLKSDEFVGFRVGTLLSYADGVFVVTEDNTVRAFGSPDILLGFGYTFNHVLPANAEEIGIYTRGKIILHGQIHPQGTLFKEAQSQKTFVYLNQKLNLLTDEYADFLSAKNDVVLFEDSLLQESVSCSLQKQFLRNSFTCSIPLHFSASTGEDYRFTLYNENSDVDIQGITAGLQSSQDGKNARFEAVLLFERILQRFGLY